MRLPLDDEKNIIMQEAIEILRFAYDSGINYFDTALAYQNGQNEVAVGEALSDIREKLFISTKVPLHSKNVNTGDDLRCAIEGQLKRLKTDYIDFWNYHDLKFDDFKERLLPDKDGVLSAVRKAKEEGIIKHICFSCHAKENHIIEMIDTGFFEGVTLQYNMLDKSNSKVIEYACQNGLGVVAMGPVGGGLLAHTSRKLAAMKPDYVDSLPELAVRYVLANTDITCALSGMSSIDMLKENLAAAETSRPLSDSELAYIEDNLTELKSLAKLYCTGCGYCMPCPHGVNIPKNFRLMNHYQVYDFEKAAVNGFKRLNTREEAKENLRATECTYCGECIDKCPQGINIPDQMNDVAETLSKL